MDLRISPADGLKDLSIMCSLYAFHAKEIAKVKQYVKPKGSPPKL